MERDMLKNLILVFFCSLTAAFATPSAPQKKQTPNVVPVDELRTAVAEAQYRLKKTGATISELVAVLEAEIAKKCFQGMHKNLAYLGNPTDPECTAKIERLLSVENENPVATCAKEGIDSPRCLELYKTQDILVYDSSQDASKALIDPVMRIGYSAKEVASLEELRNKISSLHKEAQTAQNSEIIPQFLKTFDMMLKIACRPVSERLLEKEMNFSPDSDPEMQQIRDKLLAIPPSLRSDYQQEMLREYEKKGKESAGQPDTLKRIEQILQIIQNPQKPLEKSIGELKRTRFITPECYKTLQMVAEFDSRLPWPVCYYSGWYTPACVEALRKWRQGQLREQNREQQKSPPGIGTF